MKHATGWNPQRPDHRDRYYHLEETVFTAAHLPATADLWPDVPPIWDQGQLGSCTAHGSLRVFLTEAAKSGASVPMLSRLMQYYDSRALEGTTGQDVGANVRDAIKALAVDGCAPESEWPYDPAKFADRPPARAYADAKQYMSVKYQSLLIGGPGSPMRTAVASGLAIVFGFPVPQSFEQYDAANEVYGLPQQDDPIIGGHCVAVTGYDFSCKHHPVPFFICDNSWNASWGGSWGGSGCTGGRFALDFRWFDPQSQLASDLWVIQAVK
jgi:C1A family cysteine protease